ncbi:hypothetical protein [Pseudarthrobacter cellobiosi]|uniref:hypothetical protein n=1 Tax=Pseudarthrobacter cellobiosi TaxID=2953654 RepID=UPI00208E0E65|nr:hypothetical protein [Pseudarthrobacter sp. HLT1-5]MCO4257421.1 hypothetical protein [Pseudarthrobacter sp. HLT1-5]
MTFSVVPFALQNASHSADVFRQAVSSLVPPGGGLVTAGDLAVTQTGTPSMNVSIGVGRIWIPGTNVGNVSGGNFSSQAMYYGQNDSAFTASVTTSDPINPRIDVVYASIEDSQYAGITNTGKLAVVAGVPTSGATYPATAPAIPSNAKAVAWVTVPANASSIVNANITNLGVPFSYRHAEYTGPAFTTSAGVGVNFGGPGAGLFTVDSGTTFNNTFVQPDSAGRVKILLAGVYSFAAIILPTTVPASFSLNIANITSPARIASIGGVGYGDKEQSVGAPGVYLPANTVIEFNLATSNAVTLGSRIKITKEQ